MPRIQSLHIYPVKSCRGIALDTALATAAGFAHDREWMIVDAAGRFLTQRVEPRMALIVPSFDDATLVLAAPDREPLHVPIEQSGPSLEVTIWRDRCAAFDLGERAAEWVSDFLGRTARLVRFDARNKRLSAREWTKEQEAPNRFSDGFPWLVVSQASLDDLNARLPEPLPMNRFRPNIVLAGLAAYDEDRIDEIGIGAARLKLVKPCTRCVITTTDQDTGRRTGDQPLRTLREYRFDRQLRGVLFAQNAILVAGEGEHFRVGQEIEIVWKN
jgi:uncharacterized protein YcbX